jgi:AcrR family transcriptional regulator
MKANGFGEELISLILDAVDRLLIRVGYGGMVMEDVANEAGIERNTLYLCFRSKGDLVLAREDRIAHSVKLGLQRSARRSGSWEDKIREMLYLRVMLRFDSVQHLPESVDDILRDIGSDLREREELYCREESKILSGVLQRGRKIATLRSEACYSLAEALVAATNSLLPFHLTRRDLRRRRDVEEKATKMINVILYGLSGKHRVAEVARSGLQKRRPPNFGKSKARGFLPLPNSGKLYHAG